MIWGRSWKEPFPPKLLLAFIITIEGKLEQRSTLVALFVINWFFRKWANIPPNLWPLRILHLGSHLLYTTLCYSMCVSHTAMGLDFLKHQFEKLQSLIFDFTIIEPFMIYSPLPSSNIFRAQRSEPSWTTLSSVTTHLKCPSLPFCSFTYHDQPKFINMKILLRAALPFSVWMPSQPNKILACHSAYPNRDHWFILSDPLPRRLPKQKLKSLDIYIKWETVNKLMKEPSKLTKPTH